MVHRMIRRVECPPRDGKGSALAADQCVAEAFRLCLRKRALRFGFACERSHRYAPQIRSEEHTSELQSLMRISYAVFCLKKKNIHNRNITYIIVFKEFLTLLYTLH